MVSKVDEFTVHFVALDGDEIETILDALAIAEQWELLDEIKEELGISCEGFD